MRILMSGSTGLVGTRLREIAEANGHEVIALVRRPVKGDGERFWNPGEGVLDPTVFEGIDVVVHLAGENIGDGRWTETKKRRIRDSRVQGTRLLAEGIATRDTPPRALVCASAIGFYGDRGDEILTEESPPGTGFLADVCQEWESAADPARDKGLRVVHVRLGMVLSSEGGALPQMLLPFKLGVGGVVGSGRQYWSWITLPDAARVFLLAVENEELAGPLNAVAPNPSTNYEFTKALGEVLNRPTVLPAPAFAVKLALGELAEALILGSTRVLPRNLESKEFSFLHSDIEPALRAVLDR